MSTGHLDLESRNYLEASALNPTAKPFPGSVVDFEYGYYVCISPELSHEEEYLEDDNFPKVLRSLINLAQVHEAMYIRFDCDGATYEGLSTYEW